MRALFVTTRTSDCGNHVRAWESFAGAAERVFHSPGGVPNDIEILRRARTMRPAIVFYIGAADGPGIPSVSTFGELRGIAPLVNLCSDGADAGWHARLAEYRAAGCFDLHVALDGAENRYIDHAAVTPIDPRPFGGPPPVRDIRCGFSGGYGSSNAFAYGNPEAAYRGRVIERLEKRRLLVVRPRRPDGSYADHVAFMRRCRIALNVSLSGSGRDHQIKGRAVEAGWAGCCLLESDGSPVFDRFPDGAALRFRSAAEARDAIRGASDETIETAAATLATYVRGHCRPEQIYGAILERVGLRVDTAFPLPPA